MATLVSNEFLPFVEGEKYSWCACNGRNQRRLVVINKSGKDIKKNTPILARVNTLFKNKTAYIFIGPGQIQNDKVIGLYLNDDCGYSCIPTHSKIFEAESVGGPGNMASKMGLYRPNTIIRVHSYKNRATESTYKLLDRWEYLGEDTPIQEDEMDEIVI